jgi:hypothetical protein
VLAGMLGPRVGIVLLWLFTDRLSNAYSTGIVPVAGFFFLPWTTFLYGLVQGGHGPVGTVGILAIIIGVIVDITTLVGARRVRDQRAALA